MKKALVSLLSAGMAVSALSMTSVSAASVKDQALKAYDSLLSNQTISWSDGQKVSLKGSQFALVNLDKDSTPELVVQAKNTDMAHGIYAIYTFRNGKATRVNLNGIDNLAYYPKKNVIRVTRYGQGYTYDYYVMNNKPVQVLEENHFIEEGTDKLTKTYLNRSNKKISVKTFNKQLKSQVGKTKAVKLTYTKNSAANRKAALNRVEG